MRPLIGITSYYLDTDNEKKQYLNHCLAPNVFVSYPFYANKIEQAGGIPVNIPFLGDEALDQLIQRLDGVLFCGGEDVEPKYYGEAPNGAEGFCPERDDFELKLFKHCYDAQKPILGICRGMQLMNVFFKGTLIQDIPSENKGYLNHSRIDASCQPVHGVSTVAGTRLNALLGEELHVNTLHHQAVRLPGEGLTVAAQSEDGLIEAIELKHYPFLMGVQWHPERLDGEASQTPLFEDFVRSSSY